MIAEDEIEVKCYGHAMVGTSCWQVCLLYDMAGHQVGVCTV
jgi:hypothetical protein